MTSDGEADAGRPTRSVRREDVVGYIGAMRELFKHLEPNLRTILQDAYYLVKMRGPDTLEVKADE